MIHSTAVGRADVLERKPKDLKVALDEFQGVGALALISGL